MTAADPTAIPFATVHGAFAAAAEAAAATPFLAVTPSSGFEIGGKTKIAYGDAHERVAALAARYRAAGHGVGHRVALLLYNRPEHFLHLLALNALGAGIVPVNPDYAPDEMPRLDHLPRFGAAYLDPEGAEDPALPRRHRSAPGARRLRPAREEDAPAALGMP